MTGCNTKSNQFHQVFVTFAWEYCCNDSCHSLVVSALMKFQSEADIACEILHLQDGSPN